MIDFEVGGHSYRARRLDAMTEEAVTRKLAPLFQLAAPAIVAMRAGDGLSVPPEQVLKLLTEAVADMSDDNATFIIGSCLSVCNRKQGASWVPIWSAGAKKPLFDDIRAPAMYLISGKVMEAALRDFMGALGPHSSVEGQA